MAVSALFLYGSTERRSRMVHLSIAVLGSLQITCGGTPLTGFHSDKVRALLVYLAMNPDRPHSRESLAALLWSSQTETKALHSLSQALSNLQAVLSSGTAQVPQLLLTRTTVQINLTAGEINLDVNAFREYLVHCREHPHRRIDICPTCMRRLRAAVALYRGPFLKGFTLRDSEPFEEWVLLQLEYFQQDVLEALEQLAEYHERRAEYGEVCRYARRQIELEPWREEAQRRLMRALALSGQTSQAIHQYRLCQRMLMSELGVEPTAETRSIYMHIRKGTLPPPTVTNHNLPSPMTSFIQRESLLTEIQDLLITKRLSTLTGAGGCGKTRLAIKAARELMTAYRSGVRLVELAAVDDPALVPQVVAMALGMSIQAKSALSYREQIAAYLLDREVLIILDNCEHLIGACADLAYHLIATCPDLTILATSREPLQIPGEQIVMVPPLTLPPQELNVGNEEQLESFCFHPSTLLSASEAVRLFVERATTLQPHFQISTDNAGAIVQICRRLDGIPLAIELAVARMRTLSVDQIAARLDDRFHLLTGSNRVALPRHQTLRALIDWSYDLLSGAEQALLRRLAVFSGGWTLEAAEQVISDMPVANLLEQLVEKSLVVPVEQGGTMRYHMLETIRHYALEKLGRTAEAEDMADRHLHYILMLAKETEPQLYQAEQRQAIYRFNQEMDNIRAALRWAQQSRQMEIGVQLAGLLWYFWVMSGYGKEGWQWLNAFLPALEQVSPSARARILLGLARLAPFAGEYEMGAAFATESLSLYRTLDDKRGTALALLSFNISTIRKEDLARIAAMRDEALAICRELGDCRLVGQALLDACTIAIEQNDYERATASCEEALELFRQVGDLSHTSLALAQLGNAALYRGDYQRAEALFLESIPIARQLGEDLRPAYALAGLGTAALNQDKPAAAFRYYEESHTIRQKLGEKHGVVVTLFGMGNAARQLGKLERARAYYREALANCRTFKLIHLIAEAFEAVASLEARLSHPERAARLLGAAQAIRLATDRPLKKPWQTAYDIHLAMIRRQLDRQIFEQAWAEGQAMPVELAITYALEDYPSHQ